MVEVTMNFEYFAWNLIMQVHRIILPEKEKQKKSFKTYSKERNKSKIFCPNKKFEDKW